MPLINISFSSGTYKPTPGTTTETVFVCGGGGGSSFGPAVCIAPARRPGVKPSITGLQSVAEFHNGLGAARWTASSRGTEP